MGDSFVAIQALKQHNARRVATRQFWPKNNNMQGCALPALLPCYSTTKINGLYLQYI